MAEFYDPKTIEEKFYKICEERGYFEIDGNKNIQEDNIQDNGMRVPDFVKADPVMHLHSEKNRQFAVLETDCSDHSRIDLIGDLRCTSVLRLGLVPVSA